MTDFVNSVQGLVTAICSIAVAVISLIVARWEMRKRQIPRKGLRQKELNQKQPELESQIPSIRFITILVVLGIALLLVGAGMFAFRVASPAPEPPSLTIGSPSNNLDVTALGQSVWFPVEGKSSNVVSDKTLNIYVLVHSGTEWHVQKPASVGISGDWRLEKAWIGDVSAPIRPNSRIRLMAVVSREKYEQDEKVESPNQLNPVAMSQEVDVMIRAVH